jgi:folate-dependent phosphoribosylglycinamide formyltransferase PurN
LLKPEAGRGTTYEIVACVTSDPECQELHSLQRAGIPARILDIRQFYRSRGLRWTDLSARPLFDQLLAETLASYRPNLVVLCGYLHVVSDPMLQAFAPHLINIHDADLAIRDPSGLPRYRGLRAVLDAILAGERETRSTVHLVTPELDAGPILLRSRAFPVHHMIEEARSWGAMDILKAYAYAHREWMMRASWGELLARAIELCAEGLLPEPSLEVTVESNLAQQGG